MAGNYEEIKTKDFYISFFDKCLNNNKKKFGKRRRQRR